MGKIRQWVLSFCPICRKCIAPEVCFSLCLRGLCVVMMASLLLKRMASSLTRQVARVNHFTMMFTSPAANTYRCLWTLSTAPSLNLVSSARANTLQPPSSLLVQCQLLPCIHPSAGMKTKSSLKRRCKDCFFVRRRGRLFVFCKTHPRHKQRQGWNVAYWRI